MFSGIGAPFFVQNRRELTDFVKAGKRNRDSNLRVNPRRGRRGAHSQFGLDHSLPLS